MCYHISFTIEGKELADYFPDLIIDEQLEMDLELSVHITGHTYQEHPIIYRDRTDHQLHCRPMEWGCIPFYVKDEQVFRKQRMTMLNARSERILGDDKSYWNKIRNRRCLIPVSGIYEYRAIRGWKKKVPYFIRLKNQPMFFLPGLYSVVELPDRETGEMIARRTFTLITRQANEVMKKIHNSGENKGRMPLFLPFALAEKFLLDDLPLEEYAEILQYEIPVDELLYHPVFTLTGATGRVDGLPKNAPWAWEKLPELGVGDPEVNDFG